MDGAGFDSPSWSSSPQGRRGLTKSGVSHPMTDEITIQNVDEFGSVSVDSNGRAYIGREYAGEDLTMAFRVESDDDDATEQNATENVQTAD